MIWRDYVGDKTDWAILPGESKTLIEYDGDPKDKNFEINRDQVRRILAQLQLEVQYQDVYEKNMPKIERNLDWFRREQSNLEDLPISPEKKQWQS